jgi:hypothetical protein
MPLKINGHISIDGSTSSSKGHICEKKQENKHTKQEPPENPRKYSCRLKNTYFIGQSET